MLAHETYPKSLLFETIKNVIPHPEISNVILDDQSKGLSFKEQIVQNENVVFDPKLFINRKTPFVLHLKVISSEGKGLSTEKFQSFQGTATNLEENRTGGQKIKPYIDEIINATMKTAIDSRKGHSGIGGVLKEGYEQIKESVLDDFRPLDRQEVDKGEGRVTETTERRKNIIDLNSGKKIGEVPIHGTNPNP